MTPEEGEWAYLQRNIWSPKLDRDNPPGLLERLSRAHWVQKTIHSGAWNRQFKKPKGYAGTLSATCYKKGDNDDHDDEESQNIC